MQTADRATSGPISAFLLLEADCQVRLHGGEISDHGKYRKPSIVQENEREHSCRPHFDSCDIHTSVSSLGHHHSFSVIIKIAKLRKITCTAAMCVYDTPTMLLAHEAKRYKPLFLTWS